MMAATYRRRIALAFWLLVLMILAPVLSGAAAPHVEPGALDMLPAFFAVPLLALAALCAAHVGHIIPARVGAGHAVARER